ncbi:hypothetical protein HK104_006074, partial [Borealophlyctis nickersoniae]
MDTPLDIAEDRPLPFRTEVNPRLIVVPKGRPFIPFPENDVHPYSIWQFCKVHYGEHEQAERWEVASHLWHEGLKLLREDNPKCVQIFGDALTKYLRVLDPYDKTYIEHYDRLANFVELQLANGPPPPDPTAVSTLSRFQPRCSTDRDRASLYPKSNEIHFRQLLAEGTDAEMKDRDVNDPFAGMTEEEITLRRAAWLADREERRVELMRGT